MIIIRHAIGSRSIWENLGLENFLTYIDPRSNVPSNDGCSIYVLGRRTQVSSLGPAPYLAGRLHRY
jgi:hypothetical protein